MVNGAEHGDVGRDKLGGRDRGMGRRGLWDHRKGADVKRGEEREPAGRPQPEGMLARLAVGGDLEHGFYLLFDPPPVAQTDRMFELRQWLELLRPNARLVEDEFLRLGKVHALDHDLDGGAPLRDPRPHPFDVFLQVAERRRRGQHACGDEQKTVPTTFCRETPACGRGRVACGDRQNVAGSFFHNPVHAMSPWASLPSLMISIGRVPKATSSLSASMPSSW
jgi:hypothetical protein